MLKHIQAYSFNQAVVASIVIKATQNIEGCVPALIGFNDYNAPSPFIRLPNSLVIDAMDDCNEVASRIDLFLRPFAAHESQFALLVHCGQGVMRSGAIVYWAWRRFGQSIPLGVFTKHNPLIDPDPVLSIALNNIPFR